MTEKQDAAPPAIAPKAPAPRPDRPAGPVPGATTAPAVTDAPVAPSASAPSPSTAPAEAEEPRARPWARFTPGGAGRDAEDETDVDVVDEDLAARKVRLTLSRVDPWSVMKMGFLLSLAFGIMIVVAAFVFWYALNDLGVFASIDETIKKIVGTESKLDVLQYVERDRVVSLAMIVAVADVVLLTALSTIGAFLYNIVAALVGGVYVTLTDE